MALSNQSDPTFPPIGSAPYRIWKGWCIGDSLEYINLNSVNFDTRIETVSSLVLSVSSYAVGLSARSTPTLNLNFSSRTNILSGEIANNSIGTIKLGSDIPQSGKALLTAVSLSALKDIVFTNLSENQTLNWNGSAWVNKDPAGGSGVFPDTDYGDIYVTPTGFWQLDQTVGGEAVQTANIRANAITPPKLSQSSHTWSFVGTVTAGNLGVNTATPNERLTVAGNISATGNIQNTGNINSTGTATVGTLGTGTTNTIIIHSSNTLQQRTVNSRVWDTDATFLSGSNTNNRIVKSDGSNRTLVDSIITDNGTNIGVNTTAPNERLTVAGNISATGNIQNTGNINSTGTATVGTLNNGTTDSVIIHSSNILQQRTVNSRVWDTNATFLSGSSLTTNNRIVKSDGSNRTLSNSIITDDGTNVGVNTTAPNERLTVAGNISATGTVSGTTIVSTNLGTNTTTNNVVVHSAGTLQQRTVNSRVWDTNATFLSGSSLTTNNRIVKSDGSNRTLVDSIITDNGTNIGVNTTAPNERLTVAGNISSTGIVYALGGNSNQWNSVFTTVQNNSSNYILQNGNSLNQALLLGTNDNNHLNFETAGITRVTILSTGLVTIAGAISGLNNPTTSFNQGSATGTRSFAANSGRAYGTDSHAEGDSTIASGNRSHAEGYFTVASGSDSHAEGTLTTASGANGSHAEGYGAKATGFTSHAEGSDTLALGNYSHAEGWVSEAKGHSSHAAGFRATAAQDYTYAWSDGNLGTLTRNVSTTRTGQYMVSASGGMFIPGKIGIGTDPWSSTSNFNVNGNSAIIYNVPVNSSNLILQNNDLNLTFTPLNANRTVKGFENAVTSTSVSALNTYSLNIYGAEFTINNGGFINDNSVATNIRGIRGTIRQKSSTPINTVVGYDNYIDTPGPSEIGNLNTEFPLITTCYGFLNSIYIRAGTTNSLVGNYNLMYAGASATDNGTVKLAYGTLNAFNQTGTGILSTAIGFASTFGGSTQNYKKNIGYYSASNPDLDFAVASTSPIKIGHTAISTLGNTSTTTRIVVDTSGNVGIGTDTPGEKLTVSGDISASGIYRGSQKYSLIAANFTAAADTFYLVNTTSAIVSATLPSTPLTGDSIKFSDPLSTWSTKSLVINRNGNLIENLAENLICDVAGSQFTLTFVGSNVGWKVY